MCPVLLNASKNVKNFQIYSKLTTFVSNKSKKSSKIVKIVRDLDIFSKNVNISSENVKTYPKILKITEICFKN